MPETALKIRLYGEPILRKKVRQVTEITAWHRDILSQMSQTMYAGGGIGLAASQVGISEAMIVADAGDGLYKLINPRIVQAKGWQVREEGCLSLPGICIKIKRADEIVLEAQDDWGKKIKIETAGLLACVFQHEIDHLKGRLIVDYAFLCDKLRIRKKLREIQERTENEKLSRPETKSCPL